MFRLSLVPVKGENRSQMCFTQFVSDNERISLVHANTAMDADASLEDALLKVLSMFFS